MIKVKKIFGSIQKEERMFDRPVLDVDINRLRSAQRLMDELALRIPPLSSEQIHALVESDRLPQYQLRRQADRYLLVFSLLVLALAASVLWHTAPSIFNSHFSILNTLVVILSVADLGVALRAARSLWLMRRTLRLRHYPYRMSRYADRLSRLSRRRRLWLRLVLRNSYNSVSDKDYHRFELIALRLRSYSIAACLFLLIAMNADKKFATTRDFVKVTTTAEKSDTEICNNINNTLERL